MQFDYEFVAIGGGSAGFNGAKVARQFSDKVAIIDGAPKLGGLCILRGCMPSKTLLYPAALLHKARHASTFGLNIPVAKVDMPALAARKRAIIGEFAAYREKAMTSGRFELIRAHAEFTGPHTLKLSDGRNITARNILIATGSHAATPPISGLDDPEVWTSDDVLDLTFVPQSVVVLGGGFVACELAQFLSRIGTKVTLLQRSPRILRDLTEESAAVVTQAFRNEGIQVITDTQLTAVTREGAKFSVTYRQAGATHTLHAAHVLNALGRAPDTGRLGLASAGIETLPSGHIRTDAHQRTSAEGVYAAGDCSGPFEIVHIAVAQGELAARHAFSQPCTPVDYDQMVGVVFTDPPVAICGVGPGTLTERGIPFIRASYPFDDHGKSILMEEKLGYVAIQACAKTGRILGGEIAGPEAGEMIHVLTTAIALKATARDLLAAPWYHPTLTEILTYPLEEIIESLPKTT